MKIHFESNEQLIKNIDTPTDVILLPEMFTSGFTMAASDNAEQEPGETLHWMQQQAQKADAVITGSLIVEENAKFYNRLYWVEPNGQYHSYNKKHLFTYADEHHHFWRVFLAIL